MRPLMSALITLVLVIMFSAPSWAETTQYKPRYNYQEKKYQMAPPDWKVQYNYMTKEYVYAPPNSKPTWNYMTGKYEMVPRTK